ncbi:4Fe-4S binding protein [Candidatus Calescamantes bacterium]|nr:4Fe-4S binding protein [Candidatus Calescamantes bacterium]
MKKLFIDMDICEECPECVVKCDYYYHPSNNGILHLRELISFALYCRRCEEAPCINSCPRDALYKDDEKMVRRNTYLCISCYSCMSACPFGTIYRETTPYLTYNCDYCIDRSDGNPPVCVSSCPHNALQWKEGEENEKEEIFQLGERVLVHIRRWKKDLE